MAQAPPQILQPTRHARRALLLALVAGWTALAACKSRSDRPPRPGATRVLLIGNSYVYYNNLPRVLEALGASASPPVHLETRAVVVGGARLQMHWEEGDAREALRDETWDHVVLQEQSTLGMLLVDGRHEINDPAHVFFPYARRFHAEARQRGTKTTLALTWSRRRAPEAQARLDHAYLTLGRELGAAVAPMGPAWQDVLKNHPDIPLYIDDGSHPSPAGTYLAACTLYATLTGRSPEGLTASVRGVQIPEGKPSGGETTLVSLSEPQARALQQAAWRAVQALGAGGGKLELPAAPPPYSLPTLPAGQGVRWDTVAGRWEGELRLYPEEWGQSPARMRLELTRDGEEATGSLKITYRDGNGQGPFDVQAALSPDGVLRFTAPFSKEARGEVRFEAVLTRDGQHLEGTAAYEDPSTLDRAFGSWRLERAR